VAHHAAGLAALTKDERGAGFAAAVREDPERAPLTPRERALLDYAIRLNDAPASVREEHLAPLRELGLTDAEILHANLVVGYFAFANRLTLGLGVELEQDDHELGG
jgi:uncharacterized peroxidase-related enzyme